MTSLHYLKDCAEINKMLNASIKSLATIHWPLSTIHLATPPGEKCGVVLFSSIGSGDNGRGIDFDQIVGVDQAPRPEPGCWPDSGHSKIELSPRERPAGVPCLPGRR